MLTSHQGSSHSYQAFNRLIAANSNTYAYNGKGNLSSKKDGSGNWNYTWDFENRLTQATKSGAFLPRHMQNMDKLPIRSFEALRSLLIKAVCYAPLNLKRTLWVSF
jgi:YD repeat-containing protein